MREEERGFWSLWGGELHVDFFFFFFGTCWSGWRRRRRIASHRLTTFKWITWTQIVLHLVVFVYRQIIEKPTPGKGEGVQSNCWIMVNQLPTMIRWALIHDQLQRAFCRYCQFASVQFDSVGDHNAKMHNMHIVPSYLPSLSLSLSTEIATFNLNLQLRQQTGSIYTLYVYGQAASASDPLPLYHTRMYVCIVGPHVHAIENKQVQLLHELLQRPYSSLLSLPFHL